MLRTASTIVWLIGTLAVMFLVLQPIGSETQLLISLATTAFLFIITRITTTGPLRYIALAAASIIVLRFAYWRTVNTLPPIDDLASFIPASFCTQPKCSVSGCS